MDEEQGLRDETRGGGSNVNFIREMIIIDLSYITESWLGRVKLLQFLFVTLAGVITPNIVGALFSRYAFFVFIIWTSFMYIVCDILLHLTSLWRRLPRWMTSPAVMVIPLCIGILAFLIGSSLVASAAHYAAGSRATTSGLGAFCGFAVMILYGVECFLHFRTMGVGGGADGGGADTPRVNPARNRPISGPVTMEVNNQGPPPYKDPGGEGVYLPTTY